MADPTPIDYDGTVANMMCIEYDKGVNFVQVFRKLLNAGAAHSDGYWADGENVNVAKYVEEALSLNDEQLKTLLGGGMDFPFVDPSKEKDIPFGLHDGTHLNPHLYFLQNIMHANKVVNQFNQFMYVVAKFADDYEIVEGEKDTVNDTMNKYLPPTITTKIPGTDSYNVPSDLTHVGIEDPDGWQDVTELEVRENKRWSSFVMYYLDNPNNLQVIDDTRDLLDAISKEMFGEEDKVYRPRKGGDWLGSQKEIVYTKVEDTSKPTESTATPPPGSTPGSTATPTATPPEGSTATPPATSPVVGGVTITKPPPSLTGPSSSGSSPPATPKVTLKETFIFDIDVSSNAIKNETINSRLLLPTPYVGESKYDHLHVDIDLATGYNQGVPADVLKLPHELVDEGVVYLTDWLDPIFDRSKYETDYTDSAELALKWFDLGFTREDYDMEHGVEPDFEEKVGELYAQSTRWDGTYLEGSSLPVPTGPQWWTGMISTASKKGVKLTGYFGSDDSVIGVCSYNSYVVGAMVALLTVKPELINAFFLSDKMIASSAFNIGGISAKYVKELQAVLKKRLGGKNSKGEDFEAVCIICAALLRNFHLSYDNLELESIKDKYGIPGKESTLFGMFDKMLTVVDMGVTLKHAGTNQNIDLGVKEKCNKHVNLVHTTLNRWGVYFTNPDTKEELREMDLTVGHINRFFDYKSGSLREDVRFPQMVDLGEVVDFQRIVEVWRNGWTEDSGTSYFVKKIISVNEL